MMGCLARSNVSADVCLFLLRTFMFHSEQSLGHSACTKTHIKLSPCTSLRNSTPLTRPHLTLCTAVPFVADGAHAVAIGAATVAAAKRVDALRDGDIALGPFPAAVTHTGALVVLAVATAQHRARRWRNRRREEGGEINRCGGKKKAN